MSSNLKDLCIVYLLASFIRLWLITSDYQKEISNRIEISTPLNSIKRVIEGKYRVSINVDPYSSDVMHESPTHLRLYTFIIRHSGDYLPYLFILIDVMAAHALYMFARRYMLYIYIEQIKKRHTYAEDAENQLLQGSDFKIPPLYVAVVYLFNPYTILNCVAMTTTVINNFMLAVFFYGIVSGSSILGIITLVLITVHSFYPIILITPLYLSALKATKSHVQATGVIMIFAGCLLYVLTDSYNFHNKSWGFLEHTYGFILQVTDQQPNVGVFWYFFMEMFEHFRLLFVYAYQMNVTILYVIPLTFKFRKDPSLLAACFITLIAIFKSYPSVGDFAFSLGLIPCWKHLYNCMQQIFISCVSIVVTTSLAPILWDLWIYWGTANANFFFGATLAFITAHIFLLTDISFAYTKREYLLKYGNCRKINGKVAKLVLE